MADMISTIENAMLAMVRDRLASAGVTDRIEDFNVATDFEDILGTPAMSVITEQMAFELIADATYRVSPSIAAYVVFKNPADPAARRAGVYPLVLAIAAILANRKLGLDIKPIQPGNAVEIFHANLKEKGLVGFKIAFTTSFDIDMVSDGEELVKLATIVANYMRQDPAQEDPDHTDEIQIPQEE